MIGGAVDRESGSAYFANDAAKIGMEIRLDLRSNQRRPLTSAEDEVN
ncbi:MAG TPA: hypothetical protein VK302_22405 [Terriglobales bacterium]|nr:hypothetical protein [Terriglobales bacterium]